MDGPTGLRLRYRIVLPPAPKMPDEIRKVLAGPYAPPPPPLDPRLVGLLQVRFVLEIRFACMKRIGARNIRC